MIAVLPLLLYPLLGMSFFQVSQFMQRAPTQRAGRRHAAAGRSPPLVDGDHFAAAVVSESRARAQRWQLTRPRPPAAGGESRGAMPACRRRAVGRVTTRSLYFPPDFAAAA